MNTGLIVEAERRLDGGDPASARRLAEQALEHARAVGLPLEIARASRLLAECLYVVGEVDAALPLAENALRLGEGAGDTALVGAALNLIGVVDLTVGRAEEAIAKLRRSYEIRTEGLGAEHSDTIESLNNLAVALWRTGAADESIALHQDALARCERTLGEGHRRTAETLNALAVKVQALPDGSERARALYERGLAAAELALGPDADLVARLLANVGMARMATGDVDGAGPMLQRALELHERHFGPTSRWTAHVLDAQGNQAAMRGDPSAARRAFERAFVIRVEELGPAHDETLDTAIGLLGTLGESGDDGGAEFADATALYMPLMALRPDLRIPFFAGAPVDSVAAEEQLRRFAARIAERTAPNPARLAVRARAEALSNQADEHLLAAEFPAAVDRLREAIGLIESAYGVESTLLVEPLRRLRQVLRMAGTESEVLPILERIAAILGAAYGEGHPLAVRALGEQFWQERREYGPAGGSEAARRIRDLSEQTLGHDNPAVRLIRETIDGSLAAVPADARPDSERLSVRRERFLATPTALADDLLSDLRSVPWRRLNHAYGSALDTPQHLRVLLSEDDRLRSDALELLGESILHQGSVYPATGPSLGFVRRLSADRRVPGRPELLDLLAAGFAAAVNAGDEALIRSLDDVPVLLAEIVASDDDAAVVVAAASLLEKLPGVGSSS